VPRTLGLALVCALLGGASTGCGAAAATAPGPSDALSRYARALASGDATTAYALLDERTRARLAPERFAALLRDNAPEMREQAGGLTAAASHGVGARAHVELRDGERVLLTLEANGWHVAGGALDQPTLATPEDAIAALRRALRRGDVTALLRVLARQTRAELEADIARLLGVTEDELDLDVDVQGDRATVRTTGGGRIELVREGTEWRVRDID